ncbi:NAD(P)-binding protein [Heliocybe sulcata]|uniref:D-xylose 1-dehydrogenase (NADP(+), D-xylono-1,5-lactone-forming) n=1 Tax=Heliocybe sulcata TaxID=5364 RepID=A0A5C3NAG2_9AGAM|nr:NAD(P)-binding protein [Heliocybe sulcata]
MSSFVQFLRRINKARLIHLYCNNPPVVEKTSNPVRFGVIGAARIAPDAIIKPALCFEDAVVVAVAARDESRAKRFAHDWNVLKAYGGDNGYQGQSSCHLSQVNRSSTRLIPGQLPNALHFEWTMKALSAGKHVLCEKPIANNAQEARKMFAYAEEKSLVLLEAWQVRFHPAIQRVKDIIDEGSLGSITSMDAHLAVWNSVFFLKDDIRFDYELGGGGLMDMGPYPISCMHYLTSSSPEVESCTAVRRSENIDRQIDAHLTFPSSIPAHIITDSALEGWGPFKIFPSWIKMVLRVDCERGAIEIRNYVLPHLWHSITVIPKNGTPWTEKAYIFSDGRGEEWWSAYRYQLEAFVDKIRGKNPQAWRSAEDSLSTMETIDSMYTLAGLPLRPTSKFYAD